MGIYLPIAEMSVNVFVLLAMGAAVGFLSGMFGVGGGFLITPLLIFYNVPPAVAVATGANQVIAASFSGALAHLKRGTLDLKLGTVLLAGGVVGSTMGIYVFGLLREVGQLETRPASALEQDRRRRTRHRGGQHIAGESVAMTDDRVLERVHAIVAQIAGPARSAAGAGPDTPLGNAGFSLDSTAVLEVILACEEEFGIVFDWERELDTEVVRTLGNLAEAVRRKTA